VARAPQPTAFAITPACTYLRLNHAYRGAPRRAAARGLSCRLNAKTAQQTRFDTASPRTTHCIFSRSNTRRASLFISPLLRARAALRVRATLRGAPFKRAAARHHLLLLHCARAPVTCCARYHGLVIVCAAF